MATQATVQTSHGPVVGFRRSDGIWNYRGIPYAAAPVGEHRFLGPVPPRPWTQPRDATASGATQFQREPAFRGVGFNHRALFSPGWLPGEEILNLNVWSPEGAGGGLPVMVWIHGGAFNHGNGAVPMYDGASFARDGVVYVSLNYRFGPEGFLALEGATPNRGLLDQVAALTWVRDNIAAFGGDPDNVTIFGSSAGATSVALLQVMPAAAGLFRRVISQSGAGPSAVPSDDARDVAEGVARRLGLRPHAAEFAGVTPQQLVAAVDAEAAGRGPVGSEGSILCVPYADGVVVPADPFGALGAGCSRTVDIVTGFNRDEANLFLVPDGSIERLTERDLADALRTWGVDGTGLLDWYRIQAPTGTPGELFAAMMTWQTFGSQTERMLEDHVSGGGRGWMYEFTWRSTALDGRIGAAHGMELPFVFDLLDNPHIAGLTGEHPPQELAERMHGAWVRFASTGDPGWQEWDPSARPVQAFDVVADVWRDPYAERRRAWGSNNVWAPRMSGR